MIKCHNLGFPRIGPKRELKFGLESFWKGSLSESGLYELGQRVRRQSWEHQAFLDLIPIGDFSFYDQVLDMSFLLGNIPERFKNLKGTELDQYFRVARGRTIRDPEDFNISAGEMTKWFDTNYHYIVPEFTRETAFSLNPKRLLEQIKEARLNGAAKPVLIGPLTYLWLGKEKDASNKIELLDGLVPVYCDLLQRLAEEGIEWVQIDEPILVTELEPHWKACFQEVYRRLSKVNIKILVAAYFGKLRENLHLAAALPVAGLHVDAVGNRSEVTELIEKLPSDKSLSLGVIDGRNIWKTNLSEVIHWLEPIAEKLANRLWIAPSCSLLHVPVDLTLEEKMNPEVKSWLAFAVQKLNELRIITLALNNGRTAVHEELAKNQNALENRSRSTQVYLPAVRKAFSAITPEMGKRKSGYPIRAKRQREWLRLPLYPTTTIGSFPQTKEIRILRLKYKRGELDRTTYISKIKAEIKNAVSEQEKLGLDVLVHGEAERNDMVEYFGEHLDGYVFSQFGWVQSYGSRCVKPPILFGDISRPRPITVEWTRFAQSLTEKPMKGMLTGPVTILNWSFVRDDQARSITCFQIALAIREEVLDLEKAGIGIIQIDEAALREGLPLRKSEWKEYLSWAVEAFRITANGVRDTTQIHTHMCYSEFNDILPSISKMDADIITIETSRSDMELLEAFDSFSYPNDIGPGVYDIHSPNVPTVEQMVTLMKKAACKIPAEKLWVNPDCGLKTRQWKEVLPALQNMVHAAKELRKTESC